MSIALCTLSTASYICGSSIWGTLPILANMLELELAIGLDALT